jgi:hypothetical protein
MFINLEDALVRYPADGGINATAAVSGAGQGRVALPFHGARDW